MHTHATGMWKVKTSRNDEQAKTVQVRHERAGADLHAADARYHITFYQTFTVEKNIKAGARRSATSNTLASEAEVEEVVSAVRADTEGIHAYFIQGERGSWL